MRIADYFQNQLPEFIREEYPVFVDFLKAYYEFYTNTQTVNYGQVKDIDATIDVYIQQLKRDYAAIIKDYKPNNDREFLRFAKEFYSARGSEQSYKYLFRAFFNKEVDIFLPSSVILKASDGRWEQDTSIFIEMSSGDPTKFTGRRLLIKTSAGDVETYCKRIKKITTTRYELFIERPRTNIIAIGDKVSIVDSYSAYATVYQSPNKITITTAGAGFQEGTIFNVDVGTGTGLKLKVVKVDPNTGAILKTKIVEFGYGYADDFTIALSPAFNVNGTSGGSGNNPLILPGNYSLSYFLQDYTFVDGSVTIYDPNSTYNQEIAIINFKVGAVNNYPGYYSTSNGFLSDIMKLQDSHYYQQFSYVIEAEEQIKTYKPLVKALLHPAGMELFGDYKLENEFDLAFALEMMEKYFRLSLDDSIDSNDVKSFHIFTEKLDDFSYTENITWLFEQLLNDESIIDDSQFFKDIGILKIESLTLTDDSTNTINKPFSETITITESKTTLLSKALTETLTIGESGTLNHLQQGDYTVTNDYFSDRYYTSNGTATRSW